MHYLSVSTGFKKAYLGSFKCTEVTKIRGVVLHDEMRDVDGLDFQSVVKPNTN